MPAFTASSICRSGELQPPDALGGGLAPGSEGYTCPRVEGVEGSRVKEVEKMAYLGQVLLQLKRISVSRVRFPWQASSCLEMPAFTSYLTAWLKEVTCAQGLEGWKDPEGRRSRRWLISVKSCFRSIGSLCQGFDSPGKSLPSLEVPAFTPSPACKFVVPSP